MDFPYGQMRVEVHQCINFLMNTFPEVKEFIEKDVPLYGDVIVREDPRISEPRICLIEPYRLMVFKDVKIGCSTRKECNNIMRSFGKLPSTNFRLNMVPNDQDRFLNSPPPS